MTQIATMVSSFTEPDILEWEIKWVLGSITRKKLEEVIEF